MERSANHVTWGETEIPTVRRKSSINSGWSWEEVNKVDEFGAMRPSVSCGGFCAHSHPPVRLSVRLEQLGFHWTDFHETLYLSIFRKSVEKTQYSVKFDKINVTLH
jgi:hypothetical protein